MKTERRKVQLTGGSTLTISLPIKWAREVGIKPGDELSLIERGDNTLLMRPVSAQKEELRSVEFVLDENESLEGNFRYLIALYLVGYDLIRLLSPTGFGAEKRKWIKEEVRKRLIGMEVVGESSKEMVLKSFLKYEDFTLQDAIRSMSKIILSMLEDAIAALEERNYNLAKDVIERDNELDRFYLLIVRQLKAAMSDPELGKKIGLTRNRDSLGYRIVVKNMERIGDHLENIAQNVTELTAPIKISGIKELGTSAKNLFSKTLASLSSRDVRQANDAITAANSLMDAVKGLNDRILGEDWGLTDKIHTLSILESVGKIGKYCEDIAEVTINMGFELQGEE